MSEARIAATERVPFQLAKKHHVEVHEIEELFGGAPRFRFVERGHREGEDVTLRSVDRKLAGTSLRSSSGK